MKFSVNWLREFVELPAKVEELADLLTFAGIEIEGIERRGLDLDQRRRRTNQRLRATSRTPIASAFAKWTTAPITTARSSAARKITK